MQIEYPDSAALIQALRESAARTVAHFSLPEDDLARTYAPGKWSVRILLHHITDAETVLFERIRRGIAWNNFHHLSQIEKALTL